MKESAYRFLIWCSGSNPDILAKCPRSEHIKHAGYGTLILVPFLLALFTMTYAISTFTPAWYFYVPVGICWAVIIFFADRFLVSSFRKSNLLRKPGTTQNSIDRKNLYFDFFSFAFLSRFILAAFIGVGIAHPFTLLYFHKDIEQVLAANKVQSEEAIRKQHDERAHALESKISEKEERVDCLRKLLIYEQSDIKINTDCGTTSGIPGFKKRAETINQQLVQAEYELNILYKNDSVNAVTAMADRQVALTKYNNTFSNGYIARENALVQLENMPGSNARNVRYFLILFLVLIDTLAVSWKAFAKRGPYDDYLSVLEDDVSLETQLHLLENMQTLDTKVAAIWKTDI